MKLENEEDNEIDSNISNCCCTDYGAFLMQ